MKIQWRNLFERKAAQEVKGTAFAILLAFLIGIVIIIISSNERANALYSFFITPFATKYNIANLFTNMIPLLVTGLALSISFQARVWNLASEGQVYFGAFFGIAVGLLIPNAPPLIAVVCILACSFAAGAVVSLLPAGLRIKWDVNELIVSFMTSLLIIPIVNYFLSGPFKMQGVGINATAYVNKAFVLPRILPTFDLNIGIIIGLVLAIAVYFFLYRSRMGTFLRLYGYNPEFAHYTGINTPVCILVSMILSGGLCGLAGGMVSLGSFHGRMIEFSTYGMGWNGIAVALVARYNPAGVIPASFLLAYLITGANSAGLLSDIPPEVSQVVIASIYYLITAQAILKFRLKNLLREGKSR